MTTEQVTHELSIAPQEAAMLCCEAHGRANAERLNREYDELMEVTQECGD